MTADSQNLSRGQKRTPSSEPFVSVIIPVYNKADVVGKAISSVIGQGFPNLELIVVDDKSTDDLVGALQRFNDDRIRLIRHEKNRGASAARNSGIAQARGHFCAFLDSDDTWRHDKLERQIAFMNLGSNRQLSCTAFRVTTKYFPEGDVRHLQRIRPLDFHDMLFGCTISPGSTLMAKRSFLQEIGPMDENLRRLEDWDFLARAAQKSPIYILNESLSFIEFVDRRVSYELIADCCRRIKTRILTKSLPFRDRMILNSTIQNELAVAAYRNGRYALAMRHFLSAMACYPRKERSYFVRIIRAVWFETIHSKKSRGITQ